MRCRVMTKLADDGVMLAEFWSCEINTNFSLSEKTEQFVPSADGESSCFSDS